MFAIGAALFVAVLLVRARAQEPFREISDGAIIELYTFEALDGRLLTGPYSRFGWHHPGPMYFYVLAPFYALSGHRTAGAQVGALAINLGALVLATWAAFALGRAVAIPVVAAVAWLAVRSGDLLVSVWNPHVILLPLIAFVIVAAAFAATGRRAAAVWMAVLASFLVQTHLATAPIVASVGFVSILPHRPAIRGAFGATLLILLIALWLPPLIEQFTHWPGNLARIAAFFADGGSAQPLGAAAAAWSSMLVAPFAPRFAVADGRVFDVGVSWPLAVAVVELACLAAAAAAHRRRDVRDAWLPAICAVATVVALLAATRIRDQIIDHELFWVSAIGAVNVGVLTATVLRSAAVSRVWSPVAAVVPARWLGAAVLGVTAIVGVSALDRTIHRGRGIDDHAVDVLVEQFDAGVRAGRVAAPLVHIEPSIWPIAAGALLQVRKTHGAFAVDRQWTTMFGEAFEPSGREDAEFTFGGTNVRPRLVRNR